MVKKIVRAGIVIILLSLIFECVFFNFRFWQSMFFKGIDVSWLPVGMKYTEDGSLTVIDTEMAGIEFTKINAHVDNVFIDINRKSENYIAYSINLGITDEGNALYYSLPETEIVPSMIESKYIRVHLNGNSEKILVRFNNLQKGDLFDIESSLNARRPFVFKWWRLLLVIIVLSLIWLFRPGSVIYKIRLDLKKIRQLLITIIFTIAVMILYIGIAKIFRISNWENNNTWMQYNYLAQSLLEGHTYLDFEPSESLAEMENPYDYPLRSSVLEKTGDSYLMDTAFYNGKYYCYFGIVPVLVFYLPYNLIMGRALDTAFPIVLMVMLFIVAAFWFVYTLIEKYYRNTSLGAFILLSNVLIAGSALTYSVQYTALYSLPITMGITFDLIGITCFMRAVRSDGSISKAYLIIGSLLIALVIGCRPNLAIAVFFAFPLFWKQIKDRQFFSIKGIGNTCCVIVPFLIVGIGIMYYNYIRFGNPLDFGATYNLTGFDMTHRGIDISRFGLGFFEYLFQPFIVKPEFPYIFVSSYHMHMPTDYQGIVINEVFPGGFFALNLYGLFLFLIPSQRKNLKNKGLWWFTVLCLISGLVLIAIDIQMVGIVFRYFLDFSMFLMMAALITSLSLINSDDKENNNKYIKWIIIFGAITIFINYAALLADGRYRSLESVNPYMFYRFKYQLCSFLSIR